MLYLNISTVLTIWDFYHPNVFITAVIFPAMTEMEIRIEVQGDSPLTSEDSKC